MMKIGDLALRNKILLAQDQRSCTNKSKVGDLRVSVSYSINHYKNAVFARRKKIQNSFRLYCGIRVKQENKE